MRLQKLALVFGGVLAVALALGCESNTGISTAPTTASNSEASKASSFTPADPAAKASADEAKAKADSATEEQSKSQAKSGDTGAPGATPPKKGDKVAVIDTNLGRIVLKFFPNKAPGHVKNFISLANKKFYDGTKFHRVIPGFMIQGGDPNTRTGQGMPGTGGPGYMIKAEFNDTKHTRGILSMARSADPDSAGSQFFICVATYPSLDGQYTAFGQVVQGMDVVDKIVDLPRDQNDMPTPKEAVMKTVRIETWPLKK